MVYLHRIYTKTGDAGETGLGNGQRVPKTDLRIVAYGGTDELNSVLGMVRAAAGFPTELVSILQQIQNDLFDVGADLCVPEEPNPTQSRLRVRIEQSERLERCIDDLNERLSPLHSFVLPGGTPAAAHLHHARTVCRRVEVGVLELAAREPVNEAIKIYLNRLSDLLFVMARVANDNGNLDLLWKPGANVTDQPRETGQDSRTESSAGGQ